MAGTIESVLIPKLIFSYIFHKRAGLFENTREILPPDRPTLEGPPCFIKTKRSNVIVLVMIIRIKRMSYHARRTPVSLNQVAFSWAVVGSSMVSLRSAPSSENLP